MPIENVRNRGYFKIEGAARAFNFDFRNKVVLDVGSSTGGFTQYALDRGAKKVIAVEKGTNQMVEPLRHDPRVELHEKTDIFDFGLRPVPDVILADVSFISLTKILNHLKANFKGQDVDYLIMLKPQFEARPDQLNKGVVKNEKIRREVIKNFEQWLKVNGFIIIKKRDNDLKGKTGNQERFYYLRLAK
ncbi:MAG: TlyA family rRNA (cytidine-2'-O)-methyltransferase [Candidatus Saccharibacteria bacterium]|nr:TlyA family rRNA (cytidine-2'-O)-methyltransferase [Candidatus Saccharibacteria bacterium]